METTELELALEELETRLERLRALYEQYFLGIEKIEPQVARKDVERRIYVLRREKIRNTARRFKLQTIIQRFNTFQQYWQRICREIENGTYKRHVLRAERIAPEKLLTIAARKRLGLKGRTPTDETEAAEPTAASDASAPPPSDSRSEPIVLPTPRADVGGSGRPGQVFETLTLDMGFLGDWDPGEAGVPKQAGQKSGSFVPFTLGAPPDTRPPTSAPPSSKPSVAARAPAKPPKPAKPRRESAPSAALSAPAPASPPAAPPQAAARPSEPAERPSTPEARPAARRPAAAAARSQAATSPEAKSAPRRPAPAGDSLSEERLRDLHARLVDAKQKTNDPGKVSVEGLAKSLKQTEAKLREQHKGRRIDFDIVIRNGKAVVKPIVH